MIEYCEFQNCFGAEIFPFLTDFLELQIAVTLVLVKVS